MPRTATESESFTDWDVRKGSHWILPIKITELWFQELIGRGGYGKVYEACSDRECTSKVVVKFQQLSDTNTVTTFEREAAISRLMDYNKVGPKIFFAEVVEKSLIEHLFENHPPDDATHFGVIVMDQWDGDLAAMSAELFNDRSNVEKALQLLRSKIARMSETIVHCDLTFKNVLVRVDRIDGTLKLRDLAITDYGLSIWNRNKFEINTYSIEYFTYLLATVVVNLLGKINAATISELGATKVFSQAEIVFLKQRGKGNTFQRLQETLRKDYHTIDRYILRVLEYLLIKPT